jgi:hypothetical protein
VLDEIHFFSFSKALEWQPCLVAALFPLRAVRGAIAQPLMRKRGLELLARGKKFDL